MPQVSHFLAVAVTYEVERQPIVGVGHRCCLRLAIGPHGREAHVVMAFKLFEDEALRGGCHGSSWPARPALILACTAWRIPRAASLMQIRLKSPGITLSIS